MKLLFVENRYATWVYAAVAKRLAAAGHEIHWLVQNPMFTPPFGTAHVMPFAGEGPAPGPEYHWLKRTDRGVLHFGRNGSHYPHYDGQVSACLGRVRPDVVFGEATEFHELLAIRHCKALHIPYLSPNATRYPVDRMAFLSSDTLDPVGGDGSVLSDAEADAMVRRISKRDVVPSYVRPAQPARSLPLAKLADKARISLGWVRGERFITPSPAKKVQLEARRRQARTRWESRGERAAGDFRELLASGRPWVLYALQMQPEGNIDVWGVPWNDQAELIRRAAAALAATGATLVVKPNPKSKYEMCERLNEAVEGAPNVLGIPHSTPMGEVLPRAPLVLAVTGTVLLECIFSGKPVACLGAHAMAGYSGVTSIENPEAVAAVLREAVAGRAGAATLEQAKGLLKWLHTTSYKATVWDPVAQPDFGTPERVDALAAAFDSVLRHLERKPA